MTRRALAGWWLATFAVLGGAYLVVPELVPSGDEPSYLMLAQSIALDGDADLADDVQRADRIERILPGANTIDAHAADYRGDGRLRTVHPPGLPVLLAPAVAASAAFDISLVHAARLEVAALAATASVLLLVLLVDLAGGRVRDAVVGAVVVVATIPVLPFATQVYPEIPALVAVLAALVALRRAPAPWAGATVGVAVGTLPWLHLRFAPLAAGLAVAYVVAGARRAGWDRLAWLTPLVALPVASIVVLNVYNRQLYGSRSPTAAYAIPSLDGHRPSWSTFRYEGVGNFVSASSGWFPYAPVAVLAVAAACAVVVRRRSVLAWTVAGSFAAYAVAAGASSAQGSSMPARFLVVVAPVAGIGVVALLRAGGRLAAITVVLAAVSVVVAVAGLAAGDDLVDEPGYANAPIARTWAPLFPTLVNDERDTVSEFGVVPGAANTTGRVDDVGGVRATVAEAGVDEPGFLAYGPYVPVYPARWEVEFPIAVDGPADETLVCADVAVDGGATVLAATCVGGTGGWRHERLGFTTGRGDVVETRVHWRGQGRAAVSSVVVEQVEDLRPSRGWPWVAMWAVVLAALTAWLVRRLPA